MRNAFRIFRRDMGRLLRNPAALLVIIGVSIIPSLYAWFNIAANIDPYANTSGIKVAVANNDSLVLSAPYFFMARPNRQAQNRMPM